MQSLSVYVRKNDNHLVVGLREAVRIRNVVIVKNCYYGEKEVLEKQKTNQQRMGRGQYGYECFFCFVFYGNGKAK